MDIRGVIINYMKNHKPNEQMLKSDMLEAVAYKCDCTQREVAKAYTELKKEKITYSVIDMPGWIGIHLHKL